MAYIKDTGTPGINNAELPAGAVLDTTAKTLSLDPGTDLNTEVLLTSKEWVTLETRNIDGTANLIGECIYTEDTADLADIPAFIEAVRSRMVVLHGTFSITAIHHKTLNVIDIYRGDEATVATCDVLDTNMSFNPPAVWNIDDLTPFAPSTVVSATNMIDDPSFDDPSKHTTDTNSSVSGGKGVIDLTGETVSSGIFHDYTGTLEAGVSYNIGCKVESHTAGAYRFFIGIVSTAFLLGTGTKTHTLVCDDPTATVRIQGVNGCVIQVDDFFLERV